MLLRIVSSVCRYCARYQLKGEQKPVPGSLDKNEGRRFHLLLSKRLHLLPPFMSNEPGTGEGSHHRYLMTRLSSQVVYLWRHISSTAPPYILWWSNLEILFCPLHRSSPFIGELRCQAIQMEQSYIAERTQNAVYIVRCLWISHSIEEALMGPNMASHWCIDPLPCPLPNDFS
jgi:hypothetical protein